MCHPSPGWWRLLEWTDVGKGSTTDLSLSLGSGALTRFVGGLSHCLDLPRPAQSVAEETHGEQL